MNRRTTAIVCAASGLVAADALIDSKRVPASPPRALEPAEPVIATGRSGDVTAAAPPDVDFGHGSIRVALSSGKVVRAGDGQLYMAIDLAARDMPVENRPSVNLAIVI